MSVEFVDDKPDCAKCHDVACENKELLNILTLRTAQLERAKKTLKLYAEYDYISAGSAEFALQEIEEMK